MATALVKSPLGFRRLTQLRLSGKTVLLRADYNVPLDPAGQPVSDFRLRASVPTIEYLIEKGCRVVIVSHLGRPEDAGHERLSLAPVARRLQQLLDHPVAFAADCVGPVAEAAVRRLKPRQVLLLENLRFHAQEKQNDDGFARQLAALADVFVQDAFGAVHRAHASTVAITGHLPAAGGLLLEREAVAITAVIDRPPRPLMAVVGGAKIADKMALLERFIEVCDYLAVGGAMANTLLLADGVKVGASKIGQGELPLARRLLRLARDRAATRAFGFYLPEDGVVARSINDRRIRLVGWRTNPAATIASYPGRPDAAGSQVGEDEMILDIGPFSAALMAGAAQLAGAVIWNGTLGVTEVKGLAGAIGPFAGGTETVLEALLGEFGRRPYSLVGGGDTSGYLEERGLIGSFNHVSTGGGACLALLAGQTLPGLAALPRASGN